MHTTIKIHQNFKTVHLVVQLIISTILLIVFNEIFYGYGVQNCECISHIKIQSKFILYQFTTSPSSRVANH